MNLLLDTHTILWALSDDERLSDNAKSKILAPDNHKFVSLISAWEIAIKISLNKLLFEGGVMRFLYQIENDGFELLPIRAEHIALVETLPFHHRDPFDRLMVATAIAERMAIITADTNIRLYDINCIW
jgi:PIN domain nuclease of toxin-antitoxin system